MNPSYQPPEKRIDDTPKGLCALEFRLPRIAEQCTEYWATPEFESYVASLMMDSRDGGRELWAIPKDLCDFERTTSGDRVRRTEWRTSLDGRPIARARFTDVSGSMLRTPFRGSTWQQRREPDPRAGEEVVAPLRGSARSLPCRGTWEFDELGPLGWLAGKRPIASFRMADFAMSFG